MSSLSRYVPRVMIVDDDPTQRLLLQAAVKDLDVEIVALDSGDAAVVAFRERPPALVFLDIVMPGRDGFETCREMRAAPDGADPVIVMMTGTDSPEAVEEAYEAGATDFVIKPLNLQVIRQRARYQLRAWDVIHRMRESEARLRRAQEIARLGDWEMDLGRRVVRGSRQFYDIMGIENQGDEISFEKLAPVVHPDDRSRVSAAFKKMLTQGLELSLDHRTSSHDGEERVLYLRAQAIRDVDDHVIGARGVVQDITREKRTDERIRKLTNLDELTGYMSREGFREQGPIVLRRALVREVGLGFVFLDLDGFRAVNAAIGYKSGDEVLGELARRLREAVELVPPPPGAARDPAFARVGGDEFVFMAEGYRTPGQLVPLVEAVLAAVRDAADLVPAGIRLSASLGTALAPDDGDTIDALQIHAEADLMHAKSAGRAHNVREEVPFRS